MFPQPTGPVVFRTTRWSLVAGAVAPAGSAAGSALQELCQGYWPPLYAFLRRRGSSPEEAQDLVQGFFLKVLEKDWLAQADRNRGRFRTFLLAALRHFAANERAQQLAQKRGGPGAPQRLDGAMEEEARLGLVAAQESPERAFERRYAETVVQRALERLAVLERGTSPERAERFDALRPLLWGEGPTQRTVAEGLGISETALKVALHRLRLRLGEAIRTEVADTVADPAETDAEIRALAEALRRN